jgi:DNA repair exonuclease SbcCD nuclease subunit
MTDPLVRILFLADTHLGLDLPLHPRINRRRRGVDFFENFNRALEPAFKGDVDLVVHGGDVFYRSRVPAIHVTEAFKPLLKLAEKGTPVFIVPGNHERSRIPDSLFVSHPNIHIFDEPKTFTLNLKGVTISLSGFPFCRYNVRDHFRTLVGQTGFRETRGDLALLCMHQIVEGAKVGPKNYTFKYASDVIKGNQIPGGFAAILSGHIHRAQVLSQDLAGKPLASLVLYPGSTERTSFAERYEKKGYFIVDVAPSEELGGSLVSHSFVELPTRPMYAIELDVDGLDREGLKSKLSRILAGLHSDGVVRVRVQGAISNELLPLLHAETLRSLAPPTMNIHLAQSFLSQPQRHRAD